MTIKPNETRVSGEILAVESAEGGRGFDITLQVKENESAPGSDFIQPGLGSKMKLFAVDRPFVKVGDHCKIKAQLLGGPFGQRNILVAANKTAEKK